jgi:hypothetical protein
MPYDQHTEVFVVDKRVNLCALATEPVVLNGMRVRGFRSGGMEFAEPKQIAFVIIEVPLASRICAF